MRFSGRSAPAVMGEVYRARDVRLDRSVAIKTVAADHVMDADLAPAV
jgi:hypothetical protein